MELQEERQDKVSILSLAGRIDSSNAKTFEESLMSRLNALARPVLLDLSALQYISSAGLRVVLMAAKQQQARSCKFALCSPSPEILEVFEVSGFNRIIEIHREKAAALAGY